MKQIILKMGGKEIGFKIGTFPSLSYYSIFETILKSVRPLSIVLFFVYVSLVFASRNMTFSAEFGSSGSLNLMLWTFLYIIVMLFVKVVQSSLNPKNIVEIFPLDSRILSFVLPLVLIDLLPIRTLAQSQYMNFSLSSSLSLLIFLFLVYFLATTIQKLHTIHVSLLPCVMLIWIIFFSKGKFESSVFIILSVLFLYLLFFLAKYIKNNTLQPILRIGVVTLTGMLIYSPVFSNREEKNFAPLVSSLILLPVALMLHKAKNLSKTFTWFLIIFQTLFLSVNIFLMDETKSISILLLLSLGLTSLVYVFLSRKIYMPLFQSKFKGFWLKKGQYIPFMLSVVFIGVSLILLITDLFYKDFNPFSSLFVEFPDYFIRFYSKGYSLTHLVFGHLQIQENAVFFSQILYKYGSTGLIISLLFFINLGRTIVKRINPDSIKYALLLSLFLLVFFLFTLPWVVEVFITFALFLAIISKLLHSNIYTQKTSSLNIIRPDGKNSAILYTIEIARTSFIIINIYIAISLLSKIF